MPWARALACDVASVVPDAAARSAVEAGAARRAPRAIARRRRRRRRDDGGGGRVLRVRTETRAGGCDRGREGCRRALHSRVARW